jgi:hypothetical protein
MPTARFQFAAATASNVLYVAGGNPFSSPVGTLVEVYSVLTDTWVAGPPDGAPCSAAVLARTVPPGSCRRRAAERSRGRRPHRLGNQAVRHGRSDPHVAQCLENRGRGILHPGLGYRQPDADILGEYGPKRRCLRQRHDVCRRRYVHSDRRVAGDEVHRKYRRLGVGYACAPRG